MKAVALRHQRTFDALKKLYSTTLGEPVPDKLTDLLRKLNDA